MKVLNVVTKIVTLLLYNSLLFIGVNMYLRILKLTGVICIVCFLFSGCSTKYNTKVQPWKGTNEYVNIEADHTSTLNKFNHATVKKENLRYALAISAQAAKDAGFKYFNIIGPEETARFLNSQNVTTIEDVIEVCEDTFSYFSIRDRCNSATYEYGSGVSRRYSVIIIVRFSNEEQKEKTLFHAENILNEAIDYGLNPEYFRSIER